MYKIYINERPLILCHTDQTDRYSALFQSALVARYPGKKKFLVNYIDQMEKSDRHEAIILYSSNYEGLVSDYQSLYKIIEAAGGVVINEKNEILFIHRLGWWDLPKGKIEEGEATDEGALREVEEETGIHAIELKELLHTSYHTYHSNKGKRILKRTYWFLMHAPKQHLIPQTEEAIEQAVWMSRAQFDKEPRKVYRTILEVLEKVPS